MTKILYAPGFGAGWSTWADGDEEFQKWMLTYQPIIDALERNEEVDQDHPSVQQFVKEAKEKFDMDYVCVLAAHDLEVADVSGPFYIHEYDGSESIKTPGSDHWIEF